MSSVRMCDKCSTVFSENEDGWQTFTATTMVEDETGNKTQKVQHLDTCPACALIPRRQFQKEIEANKAGDELQARIAKLERETGIADKVGDTRL